MNCACGSLKTYSTCCEPFITGKSYPETAEQLMRSRYTAYTLNDINYIKKTLAPESQKDFDVKASKEWAANAEWLGLKISSVKKGAATDTEGIIDFTVTYKESGKKLEHHEISEFRKDNNGHWLFVDGDAHTHEEGQGHHHHVKQETVVRAGPKVGRNDPCVCGSGKKYKKCCGAAA
jgi:SEC-C motif-containing protein